MIITDVKALGKQLRDIRKKKGLSQQYISDFTGLSVSFISDLENGKATAEIGKILLYTQTLSIDLSMNERG